MINICYVCTPINHKRICHHILTGFFKLTLCIDGQVIPRSGIAIEKKTDSFKKLVNLEQSISAVRSTLVQSFTNSLSINAFNLFAVICEMPNLSGKTY